MATKKSTKAPLTVETLKHDDATRKNIPITGIIPKPENLASLVLTVRGEKVLLDTDLAELYGVEARALNQAVARNRNRFPDDFMFQLTPEEWERVRSQTVTASGTKSGNSSQTVMSGNEGEPLRSQTVISKGKGGRRYIDFARRIKAMEMRYDEQISAVFDAIKQLISDYQAKKSKSSRPIGFL